MKNDYIRIVVRGVILGNGYVLVAHCKDATNTFLPGGHVEFGESLPNALARELMEEVGLCVQVSNYLGMVEQQWIGGDRHRHQINHVFATHFGIPLLQPSILSSPNPIGFRVLFKS